MHLLLVGSVLVALSTHVASAAVDIAAANDAQSNPAITPQWSAAITKARNFLNNFTLEQKVALATGIGWQNGPCVGNTPAIPEANFPGLCLQDSPLGVRLTDLVSAFPAAINAAATFNRDLIRQRGAAMGAEFRGKGVNVALGPMMNMGRVAQGGRNWEGWGADPFLAGEGAFETIQGIQSQGVIATAKHFMLNEQEHFRDSSSSNADDRTKHEVYAAPFLKSVLAGVGAVMCSYNQANGTFACENDDLMNQLLKNEFGFPGFVMSDWWATHSTISAARGLDMTMPGDRSPNSGDSWFGQTLIDAVNNGTIPESRVTDMATRILSAWFLVGQNSNFPTPNFSSWSANATVNQHVNVQADHATLIRQMGAASTVLLKNTKSALPLSRPRSIAVIGSDAGPAPGGPNEFSDRGGDAGILAMGWGSGTVNFPYLVDPLSAITNRAKSTGSQISSSLDDFDLATAASTAAGKDVALVFINSDSGEDYITVDGNQGDRNNLTAWHGGDALVLAVAAANKNTMVVVHSVGPLTLEPWIDHPNITGVLWAGIAGQEAGNAVTQVLFGDVNPSGRLPYTIAKDPADFPAQVLFVNQSLVPDIPYTEGLFVDYRHFDAANIQPRFEFGFGLSYTTFAYSGLTVRSNNVGGTLPTGTGSSANPMLHATAATVSFTIKNTGRVAGTEIPQLYLSPPASANSPPFLLKGFDSVFLQPGQSAVVSMDITRYDLSQWSTAQQAWVLPKGTTGITVGASSRDRRLKGSINT